MKPTIVYLHGLNCSSKIFSFLHEKLPDHVPHFIDYQSHESIEHSYSYILTRLPQRRPFSIVGHSLGGVIGYLIASRTRLKVQKLVTISSPFGGSKVSGILRWFYPQFHVFKDLAPRSKIIKEISEHTPTCPFLSLVSIAGSLPFISEKNDGIVTIESQTCVYPTKRVELNANHFETVQDMNGVESIREFLFK